MFQTKHCFDNGEASLPISELQDISGWGPRLFITFPAEEDPDVQQLSIISTVPAPMG